MSKKYDVVKAYLLDLVLSMPEGTKIPAERELVSHFGFSRPTIQKAIEDLLTQGHLFKIHRRGTFTCKQRPCISLNPMLSLYESAANNNVSLVTTILDKSQLIANEFIASKLHCAMGTPVHFYVFLHRWEQSVVSLDYTYFITNAVCDLSTYHAKRSIYRYIEDVGRLTIASSDVKLSAILPEPEIAQLLEMPDHEPVLEIERYSRLKDGSCFEYTVSYANTKLNRITANCIRL